MTATTSSASAKARRDLLRVAVSPLAKSRAYTSPVRRRAAKPDEIEEAEMLAVMRKMMPETSVTRR
jgi:hypothetical protein